jgi:hypothetical protein
MLTTVADKQGSFEIYLIDAPLQFAGIKAAWQSLEGKSGLPDFFQSYAWCGHVAEVMTRTQGPLPAVGCGRCAGWRNGGALAAVSAEAGRHLAPART